MLTPPPRPWILSMIAGRVVTTLAVLLFCGAVGAAAADTQAAATEESSGGNVAEVATARMAMDEAGRVVDFKRDIVPIFRAHCLECHGPDEAKNDFRIDDPDSVFDYVEVEDALSSSLFADYMTSTDDDMLMPPRSHGGPLTAAELALVRLWIDEGADWPEDALLDGSGAPLLVVEPMSVANLGLATRVWLFQGFLHPAAVHFPIALLIVGAVFVVLGWRWPALGTQIPLACLLIGAGSSILASVMGWSFSVEKGYGAWYRFDLDAEIFWHRWTALVVTVLASFFAIIALGTLRSGSPRWTSVWKVGLLLVAGLVAAVGHQGGELTYGKAFYPKAFGILFGKPHPKEDLAAIEMESAPSDAIEFQELDSEELEIDSGNVKQPAPDAEPASDADGSAE